MKILRKIAISFLTLALITGAVFAKEYFDTQDFTGATTTVATPTADAEAATKKYVDDNAGGAETDPIYSASSWFSTTNNSTNWNTAYGWGDHSSAGYLTDISGFDTDDLAEGTTNIYSPWLGATDIYYNGGNVGIGTITPDTKLSIEAGGEAGIHLFQSTYPDGGMYLTGSSDNIGVFSAGTYYDSSIPSWVATSTEAAGFEMKDGGIKFRMNDGLTIGSQHTLTDRVAYALDANGNTKMGLGLGQNVNPSYAFHAKAQSGNGFLTFFTEDTTASAGLALGDKNRAWGGQVLYDNSNDFMYLKADVNSVITIDGPNERVGINWTSPTYNFGVVGTSLMYGDFQVGTSATYSFDSTFWGDIIMKNGSLGIGTDSPASALDVAGGIRADQITSDPCGTTGYPEATIFYNDTSDYYCFCDGSDDDLQLHDPATACF